MYSDDEGQTWQGTEQSFDISPYVWACPAGSDFIQQVYGTVILTVFGCVSDEDSRTRLDCTGLFRSTDGGESRGDFSLIAYDKDQHRIAYNEMEIARVRDQLWVAFMRTDPRDVGNESSLSSRAISTDGGYTWSEPELYGIGGAAPVEVLPDGAIRVGALRVTYDLGRNWTPMLPSSGNPILLDNDTLLLGHDVYRRQ